MARECPKAEAPCPFTPHGCNFKVRISIKLKHPVIFIYKCDDGQRTLGKKKTKQKQNKTKQKKKNKKRNQHRHPDQSPRTRTRLSTSIINAPRTLAPPC